jgi:predicted negative regulator of RcsB-dependent stress response
MEERQTKIREGAGLEESRINREFIDWLQRWSTPILLLIAVAALGYLGYQWLQQKRAETVALAFQDLEAAASTTSPNPRALEDVAQTYRGVRAVSHVASLVAADEYLRAARLGIVPGAEVQQDGTYSQEDLLSGEQRNRYLADAERLYTGVLQATHADTTKAIHAISAAYGLAAVAETRGDLETARGHYERTIAISERVGYHAHAAVARQRIDTLSARAERPRLYAAAELPPLPGSPQPQAPDAPFAPDIGSMFDNLRFDTFEPLTTPASPTTPTTPTSEPPGEPAPAGEPPADEPQDPSNP